MTTDFTAGVAQDKPRPPRRTRLHADLRGPEHDARAIGEIEFAALGNVGRSAGPALGDNEFVRTGRRARRMCAGLQLHATARGV